VNRAADLFPGGSLHANNETGIQLVHAASTDLPAPGIEADDLDASPNSQS
jgi:hypothetical protein